MTGMDGGKGGGDAGEGKLNADLFGNISRGRY